MFYCFECGSEKCEEVTEHNHKVTVRGDDIFVTARFSQCEDCGEQYICLDKHNDYLDDAYRIYRQNHKMMMPEDIEKMRKKLGLSFEDLSRQSGIAVVTLKNYEHGALQSSEDDKVLQEIKKGKRMHLRKRKQNDKNKPI